LLGLAFGSPPAAGAITSAMAPAAAGRRGPHRACAMGTPVRGGGPAVAEEWITYFRMLPKIRVDPLTGI